MVNHQLGNGPALTCCAYLPDLHHFRGSYGSKEILPLYRDRNSTRPNIAQGSLDLLGSRFGCPIAAEDLFAYTYALLAHPSFTSWFHKELATRELRVPLTTDHEAFAAAVELGRDLIHLHTYGERMYDDQRPKGLVSRGAARCLEAVPDDKEGYPREFSHEASTHQLHVGTGVFGPVSEEVFEYEVSGLRVVKSWLGYRMKDGRGRKSSPLDDIRPMSWGHDFTKELLEMLWVLERTIALQPRQAALLSKIIEGPLILAHELPPVPESLRKPPRKPRTSPNGSLGI